MILKRTHLLPGIVGVFVSLACGIGIIRNHTQPPVVYGHFNSKQILDTAAALSDHVPSFGKITTYSAEPMTFYKQSVGWTPAWIVECADAQQQPLGHFILDANTGSLLEVICSTREKSSIPFPLTQRQATLTACDWLTILMPEKRASFWKSAEVVDHNERLWILRFRSQEQVATLEIGVDGSLVLMQIY